jgi:putative transposase
MDTKFGSGRTQQVYEFMRAHRHDYDVRLMCRVLEVTPSGYYAWLKRSQSHRAAENTRLVKLIRASFNASNGIYGSPRVFLDLREAGETCSKHRVARLMRVNKIRAVRGYSRKPKFGAKASEPAPNVLQRDTAGNGFFSTLSHPARAEHVVLMHHALRLVRIEE